MCWRIAGRERRLRRPLLGERARWRVMLGAIAFKVGSVIDGVGVTWCMLYGWMIKGSDNE